MEFLLGESTRAFLRLEPLASLVEVPRETDRAKVIANTGIFSFSG